MKIKSLLLLAILALVLGSCSTPTNITYLQDVQSLPADVLQASAKANDPVIMPGDLLQINVSCSNPDVVKPFNKTEYIATTSGMSSSDTENAMYYYLVDNDGNIDFPMLGKLKIGGKTQSAAESEIASLIYPRYINEKPGVEVRFKNFSVYTMGEVNNPGKIKASNGRINLLEAIAQSGDLTIYGQRENVMIIHTNADGSRQVTTVNLTDKKTLVSPAFNLQQNDIIYVAPNETKQRSSWSIPPVWSFATSIFGVVLSLATLVITIAK